MLDTETQERSLNRQPAQLYKSRKINNKIEKKSFPNHQYKSKSENKQSKKKVKGNLQNFKNSSARISGQLPEKIKKDNKK